MRNQIVRNYHRRFHNIGGRKLFHSFKKWLSGHYKRRRFYRIRRYKNYRPNKEQLDKDLDIYQRGNKESKTEDKDDKMDETENEKENN